MGTRTHASAASGCSNATLLDQAAHGNQSAWAELIERYERLVHSVARSFGLQQADVHDVAQTTWLRLFENLRAIRDPERLAGWLAVTASRQSLSALRQASRQQFLAEETPLPDPTADTESSVLARDTAHDLWATVAELSPRQQRLLVTLFREELDSYNEVATHCAMPIGSIGPTRARALSQLRRKLTERGLERADL